MPTPCFRKWKTYDAKIQECKRAAAYEAKMRRIRNNIAATLGLSITAVVAVAGALVAASASGVALPAAIATALVIIGYAAIFIGVVALGTLVSAIISHIRSDFALEDCKTEQDEARKELIDENAEDTDELGKLLGLSK